MSVITAEAPISASYTQLSGDVGPGLFVKRPVRVKAGAPQIVNPNELSQDPADDHFLPGVPTFIHNGKAQPVTFINEPPVADYLADPPLEAYYPDLKIKPAYIKPDVLFSVEAPTPKPADQASVSIPSLIGQPPLPTANEAKAILEQRRPVHTIATSLKDNALDALGDVADLTGIALLSFVIAVDSAANAAWQSQVVPFWREHVKKQQRGNIPNFRTVFKDMATRHYEYTTRSPDELRAIGILSLGTIFCALEIAYIPELAQQASQALQHIARLPV